MLNQSNRHPLSSHLQVEFECVEERVESEDRENSSSDSRQYQSPIRQKIKVPMPYTETVPEPKDCSVVAAAENSEIIKPDLNMTQTIKDTPTQF